MAVGFGGNWMYRSIRRCWRPPLPAKITASFWFGEDATTPKQIAPGTSSILIAFGLNRNGTLAAPPRSVTPSPTPALKAEIDEVIGAIERCQPYDMLSGFKYDQWKNVLMRVVIDRKPDEPPPRLPREKRRIAPPFESRADAASVALASSTGLRGATSSSA
jgi:hypothetical protein